MDGDPGRTSYRVQQGVQQRPVGDRVAAILHPLGLPVGGGHRTTVQMVPTYNHRGGDLALSHHFVDHQAELGAFTVAQPADPGRQTLELHPLLGHPDPSHQVLVVGELPHHHFVGLVDVFRVAGERHPAEGTLAFAEQGSYVGWHEAREVEGVFHTRFVGPLANVVAVVEDHSTLLLEVEHGAHMAAH